VSVRKSVIQVALIPISQSVLVQVTHADAFFFCGWDLALALVLALLFLIGDKLPSTNCKEGEKEGERFWSRAFLFCEKQKNSELVPQTKHSTAHINTLW